MDSIEIFNMTRHETNLATWLLKNEDHPEGIAAAYYFRNFEAANIGIFFESIIKLGNQIGIPGNIRSALIFFVQFAMVSLPTEDSTAIIQQIMTSEETPADIKAYLTSLMSQ